MSSALRAQLRELGRSVGLHVLNRLIFDLFLVGVFYFLSLSMEIEIMEIRSHVLVSFFLLSVLPAFAFTDTIKSCFLSLGFTRPISTLQLVFVPLVLSVIVAMVSFLVPASLFLWLTGTWIPLAGPSALVVCGVCCLFACTSTPVTVAGRWIGTTSTFFVMFILFVLIVFAFQRGSTDSQWIASGEAAFWNFPWFVFVGLAIVTAIAIAITVLGVQRRRCGESIWSFLKFPAFRFSSEGNETRRGNRVGSTRLTCKPFRNPWSAQYWYDFRKAKKWLLYPIFLVPIAVIAFIGVGNHFDPSPNETFYCLVWSLVFCPLLCQFFAAMAVQTAGNPAAPGLRNQNMAVPMPVFDATRPMRSDHLIAIRLLLVSGWSLVGWLIMAMSALLYLRFIGDWEAVMKVGESLLAPAGKVSVYLWIVGPVSGLLLLIGMASMFLALVNWIHVALQPRVFFSLFALVTVSILLSIVDVVSDWSFRSFWIAYGYLFTTGVVVLCVFAFQKSIVSGLLCKPYLGVTLSMWAVMVCTTVALSLKLWPVMPASTPLIVYVVGGVTLLIPLASTTAAPLGLAEQRHG